MILHAMLCLAISFLDVEVCQAVAGQNYPRAATAAFAKAKHRFDLIRGRILASSLKKGMPFKQVWAVLGSPCPFTNNMVRFDEEGNPAWFEWYPAFEIGVWYDSRSGGLTSIYFD